MKLNYIDTHTDLFNLVIADAELGSKHLLRSYMQMKILTWKHKHDCNIFPSFCLSKLLCTYGSYATRL